MPLLQMFLTFVAVIFIFAVLAWLINLWIADGTAKKIAWSALAVLAVMVFLIYVVGGHTMVLR